MESKDLAKNMNPVQQYTNFPGIESMSDVQTIVSLFTQETNTGKAFATVMTDYVRLKIYWLKTENARHESIWGMDFYQFETQSATWENAASYELEKQYYEWSSVVSELQFYSELLSKWS